MKKLLTNNKYLKPLMITLFGSVLAVVSVIYFIQSYSFYADEWGTDISFSTDAVVMLLCAIIFITYGLIVLYNENKNLPTNEKEFYVSFGLSTALISFYSLGQFFRGLAKHKGYIDIQDYLYAGILALVLLVYLGISFYNSKKK
ncbi:MAG: hypothetical protein ACI35S_02905 [Anaeroplasma sp.]